MDESCGKCVPCRVGTVQIRKLLDKLIAGKGSPDDLDKLESLCQTVKNTSLCGLGQSAPNPVLSTLKYFPEEYDILIQPTAAVEAEVS
jgi:bidirectional [NiFe] hydrogenase diaphorase subunit